MYEVLYRSAGSLRDHQVAASWVSAIEALVAQPVRYDWNGQQQWRPFESSRLAIDVVGQGCHVIRVQGEAGALAVLDTGRRTQVTALMVASEGAPPDLATLRQTYRMLDASAAAVWHPPSRRPAPGRLFGSAAWECGDDGGGPPDDARAVDGVAEWAASGWSALDWDATTALNALQR